MKYQCSVCNGTKVVETDTTIEHWFCDGVLLLIDETTMTKLYKRTIFETGEVDTATEAEVRAEFERFAATINPWDIDGDATETIAANTEYVMGILAKGENDPAACSTDKYVFAALD